ncbi:DNA methyltransferase [Limosilactobacillus mucosae]
METDNQRFNATMQPNSAFLAELKEKLPEFFTRENSFDLEKFQAALKEKNVSEQSEGYQLNFIGKDYARRQAGEMPTTVIVPDEDQNSGAGKNSQNLFFTGDNLEVLRHLQNNYQNKIDVIYIDPPYNTGSDGFVYPDSFEYSDDRLKETFGMNDDQVARLKSIQGKASHSAWLTFMYPRLALAKRLLSNTGVVFISIDENEYSNLIEILNELFGEQNYRNTLLVRRRVKSLNQQFSEKGLQSFNVGAEYVLVFSKNENFSFKPLRVEKTKAPEKGTWNVFWSGADRPSMRYPVLGFTPTTGQWRWQKSLADKAINNYKKYIEYFSDTMTIDEYWKRTGEKLRFIRRIPNGTGKNGGVQYYVGPRNTSLRTSLWTDLEVGQISKTFNLPFSNPKNIRLIKEILSSVSNKNSTVLDFFAGSSTTADAVMQLNAEDGGHRKFIMVQLPEKTYHTNSDGSEVPTKGGKAAYEAGFRSIDEISRERIRRAAAKIKADNELTLPADFDGSFKHYRVVKPNRIALERIEEFKPDTDELVLDTVTTFSSDALGVAGNASGEQTVLATWLAKDGYAFDADIQKIDLAGYQGNLVENNRLYLIRENWSSKCTEKLLNLLGTHALNLQAVVIFGYSFNLNDLRELENGLKQLDGNVSLIKRY